MGDNFAAMDPARAAALEQAMRDEAIPTDFNIVNCLDGFYTRMDPTQLARACGCCGAMDVPVSKDADATEDTGIISFTTIPLPSVAERSLHRCRAARSGKPCGNDCPFLLVPLE